ncbi:MAG: DUF6588 family protein [Balneolaceae bacterium]
MRKKLLLLFMLGFLVGSVQTATAQIDNIGEILRSGTADANLLLGEYIRPYSNGFGADLNTGWNTRAKPYRTLAFDLRVSAAAAFVPNSDQRFDVRSLPLQEVEVFSTNSITPTAAGSDRSTGVIIGQKFQDPITGNEETLFEFEMPSGSGFSLAPAPMIQATVGLIRDTEVALRWVPTISVPDTDARVDMIGFGIKHGINQYIPGGSLLPIDLAIQYGYTRFDLEVDLDERPDGDPTIRNDFDNSEWDGQQVDIESSGYTLNLLVGKNFPIFSVFGGVGIQSSNTTVVSKGNYPLVVPNEDAGPGDPRSRAIESLSEPVNLDLDGSNSVHALAGFRVRLAILSISGSYTISDYPVANVSVGFAFR